MLGGRDAGVALQFLYDLRQRLANPVQLTSDGHRDYVEASIMPSVEGTSTMQRSRSYTASPPKGRNTTVRLTA